ncbi:MAG: hypothetical protein WCP56_03420 [Candidatus Saccharibacteria bacterium]
MAAKKAATKSRSSKSNKNKNNLKWWYVLPVIAIVAVAGYAIVRFSEASTGTAYKRVGSGLQGGVRTVDKGVNVGKALEIGNKQVWANWSPINRGTSTRFCAVVYAGSGNDSGGVKLQLYTGPSTLGKPVTKFFRGTQTICTASLSNNERTILPFTNVGLYATNAGGYVSVISMYVKQ